MVRISQDELENFAPPPQKKNDTSTNSLIWLARRDAVFKQQNA